MINYIIIFNEGQTISVPKHDIQVYMKKHGFLKRESGDTFYGEDFSITWCNINKRNLLKLTQKLAQEGQEVQIMNIDVLGYELSPLISKTEIEEYNRKRHNFYYNEKSPYQKLSELLIDSIKEVYGTETIYTYKIEDKTYEVLVNEKKVFKLDLKDIHKYYLSYDEAYTSGVNDLKETLQRYEKMIEDYKNRVKSMKKSLKKVEG